MSMSITISNAGKRIQKLRKEQQLSQRQLATKSGVSRRTIQVIEKGGDTYLSTFLLLIKSLNAKVKIK